MFFFKKLLPGFLFPVPLCAGFLLLGLALWSLTKWKKLGRGLVVTGALVLLVFGYPWLPRFALRHLEQQYAPVLEDSGQWPVVGGQKVEGGGQWSVVRGQKSEVSAPRFILVLSASRLSADTNRTPAARFSDESLQRIVEGVRLHRLFPDTTLLVSVSGASVSKEDKERTLGELLLIFGLPNNAVQVCATARDTEDEIRWGKEVVGTNRVFLVSTASHLPRAMVLAHKSGLDAVPSPSGYFVDPVTQSSFSPGRLFPNAGNLEKSERALHEYLGLVWERVRGGGQKPEDR